MRILHLITDLGPGGAETVLFRLVAESRTRFEHAVVSLHAEGIYADALRRLGVSVFVVGMSRGRFSKRGLRLLKQYVADYRPDVIQSRLDHANFFSAFLKDKTRNVPIVWAVHSTYLGELRKTWRTRIVRFLCALQSRRVPVAIVSDAQSSVATYASAGFAPSKLRVIQNGVDSSVFQPNARQRVETRARWNISSDEMLFGCVARWDPVKDHKNLFMATKRLADQGVDIRCVLVGSGMTADNAELTQLLSSCGVSRHFILAGPTSDVPAVMNALDILVLCSFSESLPVSVMEAMSCGVPCIVTDVGDAKAIVGNTGWVIPPSNSEALAQAMADALNQRSLAGWSSRAEKCRQRVMSEYSLARMVDRYSALWTEFASSAASASKPVA